MQVGSLGFPELLVILVVVLLLFGPKRLPEVSRGLGKAVRDFRKGLETGLEEVSKPEPPTKRAPSVEPATSRGAEPAETVHAAPSADATVEQAPAAAPVRKSGSQDSGPGQDPPARAA